MKLSEQYYQVEPDGALLFPTDDLRRMGLHPGDRVCFAYLAAESGENLLSEFAVVPAKGEEDSAVGQIQIPEALLSQAGISPGEDVQILCLDGALLICGAETLSLEELKMVRQYLASANGLTERLAGCGDADLLLLKKAVERAAEL